MAERLSSAISSGLVHPLLLLLFGLAVSYVGNEDLARHRQTSPKDSLGSLGNPIGIGHAFRTSYEEHGKRLEASLHKKNIKELSSQLNLKGSREITRNRARNGVARKVKRLKRQEISRHVQRCAWRPFMWLGESKPKVSWAPRIAASETKGSLQDVQNFYFTELLLH